MYFCKREGCLGFDGFGSDNNLVPPLPVNSCYCPFCGSMLKFKGQDFEDVADDADDDGEYENEDEEDDYSWDEDEDE